MEKFAVIGKIYIGKICVWQGQLAVRFTFKEELILIVKPMQSFYSYSSRWSPSSTGSLKPPNGSLETSWCFGQYSSESMQ